MLYFQPSKLKLVLFIDYELISFLALSCVSSPIIVECLSTVSCRVRVAAMSSPVAASAPQDVSDITREFPQLNIDQSSSTTPNEIQNESQPPVVQPVGRGFDSA